jgi:CheY-like chemotaxis protein
LETPLPAPPCEADDPQKARSFAVLVADDDEGVRSLLQEWLERGGYRVTCAASGREAVKLLGKQLFDVVLTDVVMADGDGYELIAAARKTQPTARLVAISGGGQYLQSTDCLKIARGLGAHAVVLKPFTSRQIFAALDEVLRRT